MATAKNTVGRIIKGHMEKKRRWKVRNTVDTCYVYLIFMYKSIIFLVLFRLSSSIRSTTHIRGPSFR